MESFVDEVTLTLESGHGGRGAVSFRREKYVPKGGPDGGDGGRGGDVVIRRRENLKTLAHLSGKSILAAERGRAGSHRKRHGSDGKDLIVEVPPGTVVYDVGTGELLADLADKPSVTLLRGGIGGKGNANFATSTNQAPRFSQEGMPGRDVAVRIELKLIADVGLLGLPNAGKSSLLTAMSNARPRIGSYPFTTTVPHLGVFRYDDSDVVIADIPGIIEGAAEGHGLGLRFLKHISRTAKLLYLVDLAGEDPVSAIEVLEREIAEYGNELAGKSRIIVGNKVDVAEPEACTRLAAAYPGDSVFFISAYTREGVRELGLALLEMVHGGAER